MAMISSTLAIVKAYSLPLILFTGAMFYQLFVIPRSFPPSHYDVLGVKMYAPIEEVEEAYEKLSSRMSETGSLNSLDFTKVRYAYELLTNPIWRRNYDTFGIEEQPHVIEEAKQRFAGKQLSDVHLPLLDVASVQGEDNFNAISAEDFKLILQSDKPSLVLVYSSSSGCCSRYGGTWKRIVSLLDGVANAAAVELGEVQVAAYLAEKKSTGKPFFRSGLPSLLAFPSGCKTVGCSIRFEGHLSVDAVTDWFATTVLGLPRILYYSKESLAQSFMAKSSPHKVKVIFFSKTGERATPFVRLVALKYWDHASFAFVLWREEDSSLWWNTFEVESAPAIVFLKDPGAKPAVYHGSVNNSEFSDLMERNKYQELPQLRSATSNELGCDARSYSRAGADTISWYCVVLAGRLSPELNSMRATMRRVQEILSNDVELDANSEDTSLPAAVALKRKRLTFTWLNGETQKKYCFFYLQSETSYETCGPRRDITDVPGLFIIRYKRNLTEENEPVRRKPKTMWDALNDQDYDRASQLVARYNGSNEIPQIIEWVSSIIKDGDSRDLPFFRTKTPELVPEEVDPIISRGVQGVLSKSTGIKQKIFGILRGLHDRSGYYVSPMMYGQNAIVMNEFLDKRWSKPNLDPRIHEPTVGRVLLSSRGFFTQEYWFWICIGALFGFSLLFNVLFIASLTWLNPLGDSKTVFLDEDGDKKKQRSSSAHQSSQGLDMERQGSSEISSNKGQKKGMVLPFQPLSLAFNHVNYCVDMPAEMKSQGVAEDRLQLLRDVSGSFRPGALTALVGVSGAGKTTLMDVLAGRKTGGYIEGSISISGFPKNQETFARVSGYCEQNDIHSPYVTVYESLLYSAWLRLSSDVKPSTRKMFVDEVMELVELNVLRDALVGLPGVDGLSTEQRKRLTIAVELVANPSIIFMDEPTSGLDARAAAIVMRTVRNTVDTGRTVVCTIHQPSIDIFEAFDELLLMKRGGQVIYAGPLGRQSHKLIEYFEAVPGVPKIRDGYNPATWMLEISTPAAEAQLGVDFSDTYTKSSLYQRNQELIKELSTPAPGATDLHFPTKYSQPFTTQCKACFWKQHWSYWRNPQYNAIRFFMTIVIGLLFGLIFWQKGDETTKQQDLMNLLGAMYSAVLFLGATNASSVQSIVAIERTVFYREKAAGMYSPLPYAFAQVAIEVIYVAIQTFVYTLLLYSMIGFQWQVGKFLWFYYYILMCFIYFTMYGMMVVALTPGHQIAAIVMSFFLSFWNLFSGFLIPRPQIPVWWRWYYWASPVAWTIYGLVTSQVGDKNADLVIPGAGTAPLKVFLKEHLGFDYDFLPAVAVAHVAWCVLFFLVFAYGIRFLNFQRR